MYSKEERILEVCKDDPQETSLLLKENSVLKEKRSKFEQKNKIRRKEREQAAQKNDFWIERKLNFSLLTKEMSSDDDIDDGFPFANLDDDSDYLNLIRWYFQFQL